MKALIPACRTCGREEVVTVSSRVSVEDSMKTLLGERASLKKLLEAAHLGGHAYREATLSRLCDRLSDKITRMEQILEHLE